jgi:hypothetical protein
MSKAGRLKRIELTPVMLNVAPVGLAQGAETTLRRVR